MLSLLAGSLLAFSSNVAADSLCVAPSAMEWRSYGNQIMINDKRFNMKGLSWFGFETGYYNLYGLDQHSADWYLQWMQSNGFNAMRLPFSQDFMNSGANNRALYKEVVQKAGTYGILVMPDFHSATAGAWTDGLYTISQSQVIATWESVADLIGDEWNVFIADVFNEPHDVSNNQWGDWVTFCENVAAALFAKGVNWMIAIEGTNWDCPSLGSSQSCAWGENLMGVKAKGITFDYNSYGANRFVFSPHVYGGDVTGNWVISPSAWQEHWGYLGDGSYPSNQAASVIGEFGTKATGSMATWLSTLVNYLISIDQRNTFFWCLNPNSGDTGGLLQSDWTTPETAKLAQLSRLQPTPSTVSYDSSTGQVCFENLGASGTAPSSTATSSTTTTTAATGSGQSGIQIAIKNGANQWWFAVTLNENGNQYPSITTIRMKDSQMSSYVDGVQEWDYWKWTNGPYTGPFSFQIVRNGVTTTASNVIPNTAVVYGDSGYMYVNSAYTEEEGSSANKMPWTVVFALVVSILLVCVCVIGGVVYYRRNRNKGVASFRVGGDEEEEVKPTAETAQQETAGADKEEDAEIEVEVNILDEEQQTVTAH
jgi:endoglucanase